MMDTDAKPGMDLRVLVQPSKLPGHWVAICLERYIVAQGDSEKDALRNFAAMLAAETMRGIEEGHVANPLRGIPPAPAKYWDAFETGGPCRLRLPKIHEQPAVPTLPKVEKRLAVA
ncbi:MAG: hypothetical protein OXQ90_07705 [Gammaproteobacteria bacterium]|nr:hypothetical protein [Gammaproteobacteria bacterium]